MIVSAMINEAMTATGVNISSSDKGDKIVVTGKITFQSGKQVGVSSESFGKEGYYEYDFINLDFVNIVWELTEDGKAIQTVKLPKLSLAPGEDKQIKIPFEKPDMQPGAEYLMKISFALADDAPWAAQGHVVAWEQFEIPFDTPQAPADIAAMQPLKLQESDAALKITGRDFELVVGKSSGAIESFKFGGKEYMIMDESDIMAII